MLTGQEIKARLCSHYRNGGCRINGYPPFDCPKCTSFKSIENDNKNNICQNCSGTVFPVFYFDEDEQEFMVDFLICNSCGNKETVSPITRKEWLNNYGTL